MGPPEMEKLLCAKKTVNKTKQQTMKWEKIFTNLTSDRRLISKIYNELKKLDIKTPNNHILKMGYRFKQNESQIAEIHLKK